MKKFWSKNLKPKQAYELYKNCSELTFDRFVKILTNGELTLLIKKGDPTIEILQKTWQKIYNEYCFLSENETYKSILKIQSEIGAYQCTLLAVKTALQSIIYHYNETAKNVIVKCGYKFDENDLSNSIKRVATQIKTVEVNIERKERELKQIEAAINKNSKHVKESDYLENLITLSKHMGGNLLKANEITVNEYLLISKDYKNYIEILEKQNGNK